MNSVNAAETLEKADLMRVLASCNGLSIFEQALRTRDSDAALLSLLASYVQFNSVFGSGVANLAGEIGARQDLFRDSSDPVEALADRSAEIAAKVFYAAIDEFGDQGTSHRSTHRMLAQATLKASADFFGLPALRLNEIARPDERTTKAVRAVCEGYGLNRSLSSCQIFRGIGFHLASETLADEEFRLLDGVLRSTWPKLVAYLEKAQVSLNGKSCNGYRWIGIHTTVEAEHSDAAFAGANLAIRYYAGAEGQDCARGWIIEGAQHFAEVQTRFMEHITSS